MFCAPLRRIRRRRPVQSAGGSGADLRREVEVPIVQSLPKLLPNLPKFPDLGPIVYVPPSSFLKRLPLEVRFKIYELVLTGNVFHLERPFTHAIRHARFSCSSPLHPNFSNYSMLPFAGQWYDGASPALLFTCRQIYNEAVTIFYSQNTFHFNDPMAFVVLVTYCLSPPLVLAIRSVEITYSYRKIPPNTYFDYERYTVEAWWRMWQLIKEMRLTHLSLQLIFEDTDVNGSEDWRKPMLEVGNLKTFKLELLCWRGDRPLDDTQNLVNHSLDIAEPVRQRVMALVSQDRVERDTDWHLLQQKSARMDNIRRQDPLKWNIHES